MTPVIAIYFMFHMRKHHADRRIATMLGFFTDGYRMEVAWFWEFVVLMRKLAILGVSLFVPDAFLQSFTAVVVLILSICLQLHVKPFEMESLNMLEMGALITLLLNQLAGILLWYMQTPEMVKHLAFTQLMSMVVIFSTYGLVIAGFVIVLSLAWVKHQSKTIVQWLPNVMLPVFTACVRFETWWFDRLFVDADEALGEARSEERRSAWTFVGIVDAGESFDQGQGGKARLKAFDVCRKFWLACRCLGSFCPAFVAIFLDREEEQGPAFGEEEEEEEDFGGAAAEKVAEKRKLGSGLKRLKSDANLMRDSRKVVVHNPLQASGVKLAPILEHGEAGEVEDTEDLSDVVDSEGSTTI
jgi:hypothetical protein